MTSTFNRDLAQCSNANAEYVFNTGAISSVMLLYIFYFA